MLLAAGLVTLFISCTKSSDEFTPLTTAARHPGMQAEVKILTSSPDLLYEETFEGLGPYFYGGGVQVGTSYGFKLTSDPLFQGAKVARFELRDTDPSVSGGTRAEAKYPPSANTNIWYSYAIYFPSKYYKYDSKPEIISQWHQGSGENPSISLIIRYDNMYLEIRPDPNTKTQYSLGPVVKDKWQTFVFHINHLHSSSGITEFWKDGVKLFSKKGANAYDYSKYDRPSWKFGIYKWEWNGTKTTDITKRVLYFDNVREGGATASYSDMVIPVTQNLNPPGTIKSFALVNAFTEKDVLTIKDSAKISLGQYGLSKLNIRANQGVSFGSVRFELDGPQTRSSKDNAFPFTLMGDDNSSNYYYGSWDPPSLGNYTLTATPYSGSDGTGLLGKKAVIHFSIVK